MCICRYAGLVCHEQYVDGWARSLHGPSEPHVTPVPDRATLSRHPNVSTLTDRASLADRTRYGYVHRLTETTKVACYIVLLVYSGVKFKAL